MCHAEPRAEREDEQTVTGLIHNAPIVTPQRPEGRKCGSVLPSMVGEDERQGRILERGDRRCDQGGREGHIGKENCQVIHVGKLGISFRAKRFFYVCLHYIRFRDITTYALVLTLNRNYVPPLLTSVHERKREEAHGIIGHLVF